jgi:polyisoprenoid-binding protein YceI
MVPKLLIAAVFVATAMSAAALAPRFAAPTLEAPAAYTVDGVHSCVVFRCKHLDTSFSYGTLTKISGTVNFDDAAPESSSLTIEVGTGSVNTGDSKRDSHLKSGDFFSASEFPTATFKSKSFKKSADNTYEVAGDFTLRGKTKPITVKLEKTGASKHPMSGAELIGFETTFTINRMDYGVSYGEGMLGNDVRLTVSIEAAKK